MASMLSSHVVSSTVVSRVKVANIAVFMYHLGKVFSKLWPQTLRALLVPLCGDEIASFSCLGELFSGIYTKPSRLLLDVVCVWL